MTNEEKEEFRQLVARVNTTNMMGQIPFSALRLLDLLVNQILKLDARVEELEKRIASFAPPPPPPRDFKKLIMEVRERTGATAIICRGYLEKNAWDVEKAVEDIMRRGLA